MQPQHFYKCTHSMYGCISSSTIPRIIPPFPSLPHMKWVKVSLIPRPFLPPAFDRLQYAKTEGEGLGERVMCMMSGRREGRHEGGGAQRRISRSFLQYLVQELEAVTFERQHQYSLLFGRLEADQAKCVSYVQ